jgi:hypothetical protein
MVISIEIPGLKEAVEKDSAILTRGFAVDFGMVISGRSISA